MPDSISKEEPDLAIFDRFHQKCSDFAGARICDRTHSGVNEAPDIIANDELGNRIGVELTALRVEWRTTADESLGTLVKNAVSKAGLTKQSILLSLYDRVPDKWDKNTPRAIMCEISQLLTFVEESKSKSFQVSPTDLHAHAPTLARYCSGIQFKQIESEKPIVVCWRLFGVPVHSEPSNDLIREPAQQALAQCIEKKTSMPNYSTLKRQKGLDRLILVIHHNSPGNPGETWTLEEAWQSPKSFSGSEKQQTGIPFNSPTLPFLARDTMRTRHGPFDQAFLFEDIPVFQGIFRDVIRIYP